MAILKSEASRPYQGLSVKELKARLRALGCTDFSQFLERRDLVRALEALMPAASPDQGAAAAPDAAMACEADEAAATSGAGGGAAAASEAAAGAEADLEPGAAAKAEGPQGCALREVDVGGGCRLQVAELRSAFDNTNTGAVLWDASVRLARHVVALGRPALAGRSCVELGCGTGLAGIAAATQGARVLLTDLEDALAQTTRHSLRANAEALRAGPGGEVALQPLAWGGSLGHLGALVPFDYILAADVVYRPELFSLLKQTLLELSGPGTQVLLSYTRRRSQEEWFFSSLADDFDCRIATDAGANGNSTGEAGDSAGSVEAWRGVCRFGETVIFCLTRKPGMGA